MAADPSVVAALRKTDLFGTLSDKSLRRVAAMTSVVHHAAGKAVTEEGGSGVGFHLLTEGTASVRVGDESRGELGPGDYFGEISLIDGKPRSATVVAQTDVTTIAMLSWNFRPLLTEHPEVTTELLRVMCERLRRAEH